MSKRIRISPYGFVDPRNADGEIERYVKARLYEKNMMRCSSSPFRWPMNCWTKATMPRSFCGTQSYRNRKRRMDKVGFALRRDKRICVIYRKSAEDPSALRWRDECGSDFKFSPRREAAHEIKM